MISLVLIVENREVPLKVITIWFSYRWTLIWIIKYFKIMIDSDTTATFLDEQIFILYRKVE